MTCRRYSSGECDLWIENSDILKLKHNLYFYVRRDRLYVYMDYLSICWFYNNEPFEKFYNKNLKKYFKK